MWTAARVLSIIPRLFGGRSGCGCQSGAAEVRVLRQVQSEAAGRLTFQTVRRRRSFAERAPKTGNVVIAIDLPNPRRLALSVVLGQAAVTVVCALVSAALSGTLAAVSALLGGGISCVASLAMALVGFRRTAATDPQRAVLAFFAGEAAKVAVVIVLFVVVLKTMKVVPLAMLGSYVATFAVFWVALFTVRGSGSPPSVQAGHGS